MYIKPVAPEVPVADNTSAKIVAGTDLAGDFLRGLSSFSQITQRRQQQELELQKMAQDTKLREEGFGLERQRINDAYENTLALRPYVEDLSKAKAEHERAAVISKATAAQGMLESATNVAKEQKSFMDEWNSAGLNDANPDPVTSGQKLNDIALRYQNFDYKPVKDMIAAKKKELNSAGVLLPYGTEQDQATKQWSKVRPKSFTPYEIVSALHNPDTDQPMRKALIAKGLLTPDEVNKTQSGQEVTTSYKVAPVLQTWIDEGNLLNADAWKRPATRVPVTLLSKPMAAATQAQAGTVAPVVEKIRVKNGETGTYGFVTPAVLEAYPNKYQRADGAAPAPAPDRTQMSPATVQAVDDSEGSTDATGAADEVENFADGGRVGERTHFATGGRRDVVATDNGSPYAPSGELWPPEAYRGQVPDWVQRYFAGGGNSPEPQALDQGPGTTADAPPVFRTSPAPSATPAPAPSLPPLRLQMMTTDFPVNPTPVNNYDNWMSNPDAGGTAPNATNYYDNWMSSPDTSVAPTATSDYTGYAPPVYSNPDATGVIPSAETNYQGATQMSNPDALGFTPSPDTVYQDQMTAPDDGVTPAAVTNFDAGPGSYLPPSENVTPTADTTFNDWMSNPDDTPTVPTATSDYTGGADTQVDTPTEMVQTPATDAAVASEPTVMNAEPAGQFLGRATPAGGPMSTTDYNTATFGGVGATGYRDPTGSAITSASGGYGSTSGYGQSSGSAADLAEMSQQAQGGGSNNTGSTGDNGKSSFLFGSGSYGRLVDGQIMPVRSNATRSNFVTPTLAEARAGNFSSGPEGARAYNAWMVAHNPGIGANRNARQSYDNFVLARNTPPPPSNVGGLAAGGRLSGPPKTDDKRPAWLSDGEVVINSAAVKLLDQRHGKGWEKRINAMGMARRQNGR